MREAPAPLQLEQPESPEPLFLISHEPWLRNFLRNFAELFRRSDASALPISAFWPDVFVHRALPWSSFLQSAAYHVLALALLWAGSRFLALQPRATAQPTFTQADVIYYTPAEYLPPLDTRRDTPTRARKADPEFSAQPIISLPPEPDNRSQTIVAPPNLHLQHDVALPNIVAWTDKPQLAIAPAPAVPASQITRLAPQLEPTVIAPPPDLQTMSRQIPHAPQATVIAPPPAIEAGSARRLGDLNIANNPVIAPAPQLTLDAQRAFPGRTAAGLNGRAPQVVAPPPSLGASGRSHSGGAVIALNLHAAVGAPPEAPAGNRRGSFAATPEGHHGASGAPGASAGTGKAAGSSSGNTKKKTSGDLPSGLYVGKTSNAAAPVAGDPAKNSGANPVANTLNPGLLANVQPPRVSARTLQPENDSKLSSEERAVFGNRKFYSLTLNMPNLNSAGGSWIIRFAAVKPDSTPASPAARAAAAGDLSSGTSSSSAASTDLSAPSATRKVDPAYPLELMRQNVGGTVILYGVIHTDGTVGSLRVLRSVDDRLDHFATQAIAKWQFQPATKNGAAVDVEATFWIPFRPGKF